MTVSRPLLAIVGRPNVGKSTLFNRIVGSRRAIVGDESGITRDRLYGEGEWRGRQLRLVDTGGIIPDEKDFIPAEVFRQARVALGEAAAIVMVVDGRTELAASDLELARLLLKTGKPLFLAINKIDTEKQQALANEFHRLGIRELFPISAEHGRGVDELLDAVLEALPSEDRITTEGTEDTGEESASEIKVAKQWDLVVSGQKQPVSQAKTAGIQESKRPADRAAYEQRLRYGLKFLSYAPVLFISATNGKGAEKILPMLEKVASERRKRIPTAEMNRFLKQVDFDRASVPASKRVKIYYMTQAAVAPPTFILFTDRKVRLHFSYQRFLENQIRRAFGFLGTPIWIKNRARD